MSARQTEDAHAWKRLLPVGYRDVWTRRDEGSLSFLICERGIIITSCFHSPQLLFISKDVPVNMGLMQPCLACGFIAFKVCRCHNQTFSLQPFLQRFPVNWKIHTRPLLLGGPT